MFDDMAGGVGANRQNLLALPGKPPNDSGCRRALIRARIPLAFMVLE